MKVSLIVPVYNVRNYLRKCLDSVVAQTCKDMEVIIVNDGSTDDSLEIALEYTAKYPHFRCYTIENSGLGGARNYGMEQAKGDYFMFLDSDDYITADCVERMLNAALENDSDLVCGGYYDIREDGVVLLTYKNSFKNATTSLEEEPQILFNRASACCKLYKRELMADFRYVTKLWYEDMRLTPKLYLHAKKITYVDAPFYYYVQRGGSIMNNHNFHRNLEILEAMEDFLGYYKVQGAYEKYRDVLEFLVIEHVAVTGMARVAMCKGKGKKEVIAKMQAYLATYENLYANPYMKTMERNRKIVLWCNRHRLYWATKTLLGVKQWLKK